MDHTITKNGLSIRNHFERGHNGRFVEYPIRTNVFKRIYHKCVSIDYQSETFLIQNYYVFVDENGVQIEEMDSKILNIPVTDESFDQLYPIPLPGGAEEIAKRAMNGIIEYEFQAKNFFPFDPINGMANIQPVEFFLSANGDDIEVNHTDGSGTYQYSLDGGQNWSDASVLVGVGAGDYNVSVKDDTSSWFRTKSITVQGV